LLLSILGAALVAAARRRRTRGADTSLNG
jgi:hypothetical protein